MSSDNPQFTTSMVKAMESRGWRFTGVDPNRDAKWHKYEKGILIAGFGAKVWDRDLAAACREVEVELSTPVIDLLIGMGWTWAIANVDSGEWIKFDVDGTCLARQGGSCWTEDVEWAELRAAEDDARPEGEVWEPTMELRFQDHLGSGAPPDLQQKWVRAGSSEWRYVDYVDDRGRPIA